VAWRQCVKHAHAGLTEVCCSAHGSVRAVRTAVCGSLLGSVLQCALQCAAARQCGSVRQYVAVRRGVCGRAHGRVRQCVAVSVTVRTAVCGISALYVYVVTHNLIIGMP
jgi:hypothetical protein